MIINIIGWYGTETLGDLAILDGILAVINEIEPVSTVKIGSLYPFYTQRTLYEEKQVFKDTAPNVDFEIFDVKDKDKTYENIKKSDLLMIGGGPLMDLEEMFLLRNCFRFAKDFGIPRIIMGCGVGPLRQNRYIDVFKEIITMASDIYLRDRLSLKSCENLCGKQENIKVIGDPAIISIEEFKQKRDCSIIQDEKILVINFRDYPSHEYGDVGDFSERHCRKIIDYLCDDYEKIFLIPMHTFGIGGDDRLFLTRVLQGQKYKNTYVKHSPMNLHDLYQIYANATSCIGMRYHSVVMQTILNGNNYIVEYTDHINGKIAGFLDFIGGKEYYKERNWNIRDNLQVEKFDILKNEQKYPYRMSSMKKDYVQVIKKYMC